jgi:hypothetical protein
MKVMLDTNLNFLDLTKKDINTDRGIIDIKDKYFFKVLLASDILYYRHFDIKNAPSPLIFFSYYFLHKEKSIIPIIKTFRRLDMKVHVSPGEKLFASLTNHVISLRLKTSNTVWDYSEIFRLIDIMREQLSTYEIFEIFCFILQNHLFTFNFWDNFVCKLKYFKQFLTKDCFYLTYWPNTIFFFLISYSILSKMLLFNYYYSFFILLDSYLYWIDIIV